MGVVYRALDPRSGRRVALKLLLDTSPRFRERFAREALALARLSHPNVVKVHDAGEEHGKPYLVMELVEGQGAEEAMRRGPMEPRRAAELVAAVARGAGHAHAQGLVHRDIKPDNVLLRPDGSVVLTDFGLARDVEVSSELSRTGIFMGTPGYASPEQAKGEAKRVGPASDVYGLGALLYALLCARPPYVGSLIEVLVLTMSEAPPSARAHNASVDAALDALCRRCMAKDPAERYADGDALADALEAYLRGELESPVRSSSLAYAALGLALVATLGGAGFYGSRGVEGAAASASGAPEASAAPSPRATPAPAASPTLSPEPQPLEPSEALSRALRLTKPLSRPRSGGALDSAIELLASALKRAGPASNRAEAERRLAQLYTLRSEAAVSRTPAQTATDLRAALALHNTEARRRALATALIRQALLLGGGYRRNAAYEKAKAAYLEAMELVPHDVRPALALAEQAHARKDFATWLSASQEAGRRAPADERPQVQITRALTQAGRRVEALAGLRRFLKAHPNSPSAWCELGDQERARDRWASARRAYEQAGGEESEDLPVLEGLAYVCLEEQRNEHALALYERIFERGRDQAIAVGALARARLARWEESLASLQAAWDRSESAPLLLDLALGHLEALRSLGRDSQPRLRQILKDERLSAHGKLVIQVIHYGALRRHPLAQRALRGLARPNFPLDPRADCALVEWLTRWGTYDLPELALSLAQRAARSRPDDEDAAALVMEGRTLMRMGRHAEAWATLDKALAIHPTRADLHHTRAELGANSGRYELGLKSGRVARKLQPREPYVCIYMTYSSLGLGQTKEALPLMDYVVETLGERYAGLRALVRASEGQAAGARADLERARKRDPNALHVALTEAQLLLAAGERRRAAEAFEAIRAKQTLSGFEADLVKRQLERARQPE